MNPEPNPRAELEARLTALLLGELSADEAAALQREMAADPALAKLHDELRQTIGLVRETVAAPTEPAASQPEPLKLSDERRAKLLAHFKTVPMPVAKEPPKRRRQPRDLKWLVPMSIAAVFVLMLGVSALMPSLAKSKAKSHLVSIDDRVRLGLDLDRESPEASRHWFWSDASGRAGDAYFKRGASPMAKESVVSGNSPAPLTPQGQPSTPLALNSPRATLDSMAGRRVVTVAAAERPRFAELALPVGASALPSSSFASSRAGDKDASASTQLMRESSGGVAGAANMERLSRISGKDSGIVLPSEGQPLNEFQYGFGQIVNHAAIPQAGGDVRFDPQSAATTDEAGINRSRGGVSSHAARPSATTNLVLNTDSRMSFGGGLAVNGGTMAVGGGTFQLVNNNALGGVAPGFILGATNALVPYFDGQGEGGGRGRNEDLLGRASVSTMSRRQPSEEIDSFRLNGAATTTYSLATDFTRDGKGAADSALGDARPLGRIVLPESPKSDAPSVGAGDVAQPQVAETIGAFMQPAEPAKLAPTVDNQFGGVGGTFNRRAAGGKPASGATRTDGTDNFGTTITAGTTRSLALKESEPLPALRVNESGRGEVVAKAGDASVVLPGTMVGTRGITKSGAGTLSLGGGNTYSGGITVSNSTLNFYATDAKGVGGPIRSGSGSFVPSDTDGFAAWNQNQGAVANVTSDPVAGERFKSFGGTSPAHPALKPTTKTPLPEIAQAENPTAQRGYYAFAPAQTPAPTADGSTPLNEQRKLAEDSRSVVGLAFSTANPPPAPPVTTRPAPAPSPTPTMEPENLHDMQKMRLEAQVALADGEEKLNQLKGLKPEALREALPRIAQDPKLEALSDQVRSAEKKLAELTANDPKPRPELAKAKKQIEDLQRVTGERAASLVAGLEAGQKGAEKNLEQLVEMQIQRAPELEPEKGAVAATPQDAPAPKPATPAPIPQPEILASENAFSTFSLNVSDVSFKLAAASLEQGQMPEPASVRSEEFINAFDYRDPEALPGVPVAFAWERARYPFAHNRDLLRFSLKTAALGRQAGRALNVVLVLDNSGSMERADRVRILREALRVLASQLQAHDKLSVITFARTPRLWVDGAAGDKAAEVFERVAGLTPEGGTNIEEAMNLGYQTALRHYLPDGINRVVLLTDGAANLGDVTPDSLKAKVEAHRKQGIALDCFGIGWEGFNDDLLEVLSRNGDGRYGFLNSPEEAATEFAGQLAGALKVAASDVKVQVEFNPGRVTSWRQIGYAKHQLTKEQFRDNTVDAAEIAAQEAGNALYTIEVNPAGEGPLATVRIRFKVPGTSDYREHEWTVPFVRNVIALEHASPAMRLAATTSAFSEWLAASPFAGEVTPDQLLRYLSGVPDTYGVDARPKKLEWMIRQAKSLSGK